MSLVTLSCYNSKMPVKQYGDSLLALGLRGYSASSSCPFHHSHIHVLSTFVSYFALTEMDCCFHLCSFIHIKVGVVEWVVLSQKINLLYK